MNLNRAVSIWDYFNYKRVKKKQKKEKDKFDWFRWELRKDILMYYKKEKISDPKLQEAIEYIRREGTAIFPYFFREKYYSQNVPIFFDDESELKYVKHEGRNLYFPSDLDDKQIREVYIALLIEQDKESAHCYLSDTFNVSDNDIILDVGAAEGILSLSLIDKVHKIILFEVEERWIKALHKTFEPWKDKVQIINKYVSDKDSDSTVKLDSLIDSFDTKSVFLKLDVEGAEKSVLDGAQKLLTSNEYNCKTVICTYHQQNDFEELSVIMKNIDYKVEPSNGYMLFYYDENLSAPYFRKGLIRCYKE